MSEQNSVKISELIEKSSLLDTDVFVVEDAENTKKTTLKNIVLSIIHDNDFPANYRLYSSAKVDTLVRDINQSIVDKIDTINGKYNEVLQYAATQENVETAKNELVSLIEEKLDTEVATKQFNTKRDKTVLITAADMDTSSDSVKIKLNNLAKEVIDAITGQAKVTVSAAAPTGGWLAEDIGAWTITRNKLAENYQFVQNVTEGNIDTLTKDGFYFLGYKVEGLPKMSEDDDEPRIMRVDRISTDYIIQTVYYTSNVEERPIYIRRGRLSTLYTTDFKEVHEVSPSYRIGRDMLKEEFINNGTITEGNLYTYRSEGYYYAEKTVEGLPTEDDYLITVEKHGDIYLYTAELISLDECKVYHSNLYFSSGYVPETTQWYISSNSDKSKFDRKNVTLFGDDALYGAGCDTLSTDSIAALLQSKYGMIINNRAIMGATIGNYNDENLATLSVLKQIEVADLTNTEYAIILAGTYDWSIDTSNLGLNDSNSKLNSGTFRGSVASCIDAILTKNPEVKILLCTPFYRGRIVAGDGRDCDNNDINDRYLRDFVDVMIDVADAYHIPSLDLFSTSGINKYTDSTYLKDGLLLNNNGHKLIADKIFNAISFYY